MKMKLRMLLLSMAAFCMLGLSACSDPLGIVGGACEGTWSAAGAQECWQDDQAGCADWNNRAQAGGGYTFHSGQTCSGLGLTNTG